MDRPNLDRKVDEAIASAPRHSGVRCVFCEEFIVDIDTAFEKVEGFVPRKRAQGGANAVRLKRSRHEFACMHCIDKLTKKKVHHNQGALL